MESHNDSSERRIIKRGKIKHIIEKLSDEKTGINISVFSFVLKLHRENLNMRYNDFVITNHNQNEIN